MKAGFYPRMAANGMRKNGRLYAPYLVTCIMMVAVYYIFHFLGYSGIMDGMPGGHTATDMMRMGTYIMTLFGLLFLFYTQAALIRGREVTVVNVGDSRCYHVSSNGIRRITTDHSLVQMMVDRGDLTPEVAKNYPGKNLITRALGPGADAKCDGYTCPMNQGDYLLLCTDGLVGTVTDQEMLFEVIHGGTVDSCLERLMEIAKSQGAPDNVTAVLMQKL